MLILPPGEHWPGKEQDQNCNRIVVFSMLAWTLVMFNKHFFLYTAPLWIVLGGIALRTRGSPRYFEHLRLSTFCLAWLAWILLVVYCGPTITLWLTGCFTITWHHPCAETCYQSVKNTFKSKPHSIQSPKKTSLPPENRYFRFIIVENQRRWTNWTDRLLPHERPAWSDEYLEEVPPIETFSLPPATPVGSWAWVDQEWQVDQHETTDQNGWEYGGWFWTSWASAPAPHRFTRRRRWIRHAYWEKWNDTTSSNDNILPSSLCHTPSLSRSVSSESGQSCSESGHSIRTKTSMISISSPTLKSPCTISLTTNSVMSTLSNAR